MASYGGVVNAGWPVGIERICMICRQRWLAALPVSRSRLPRWPGAHMPTHGFSAVASLSGERLGTGRPGSARRIHRAGNPVAGGGLGLGRAVLLKGIAEPVGCPLGFARPWSPQLVRGVAFVTDIGPGCRRDS
jgi:hypothetical protein